MEYLRSATLATIIYYDIIDFPLTCEEAYKYLINPSRLSLLKKPIEEFNIQDIKKELDNLVKLNFIGSKEGYYFLNNRQRICDIRSERTMIAGNKWNKFTKAAKWIQLVPYIRGVFASGSMAMDNTDLDSDFDVLIIAKPKRIYTARLLLLMLTSLLGSRRRWFDHKAPDKLCFNHYITEDNLHISHHSLYNAQSYAHLKPVLVTKEMFENFFMANNWINKYLYNFKPRDDYQKKINPNKILGMLVWALEFILNTKLGDWIENLAKKYQQRRIERNPKTHDSGGRIVVNDHELEFHPNSFEKFLINRYNYMVAKLGILAPLKEHDSGLS